ncbi:MAG TPA: hypothetical protein DDW52_26260 [Planctomycetaceae bacterium]|nr:hypothetical protein [Planctomycetaceae bacterium]
MKLCRTVLSIAFAGSIAASASAQVNRFVSQSTPAPSQVSETETELSFSDLGLPETTGEFRFEEPSPAIDVPEISSEISTRAEASPSDAVSKERPVRVAPPITEINIPAHAPEPNSLPVAKHAGRTLGAGAVPIAHVDQCAVEWGVQRRCLTPVQQALLRTECNAEALWACYQSERAAECAKMWECINKSKNLRASMAACGDCMSQCAPQANICDSMAKQFNRYQLFDGHHVKQLLQKNKSCDAGCDSSGQPGCGCGK